MEVPTENKLSEIEITKEKNVISSLKNLRKFMKFRNF